MICVFSSKELKYSMHMKTSFSQSVLKVLKIMGGNFRHSISLFLYLIEQFLRLSFKGVENVHRKQIFSAKS